MSPYPWILRTLLLTISAWILCQSPAFARNMPPVDWSPELARAKEMSKAQPELSLRILDSLLDVNNFQTHRQLAINYLQHARAHYSLAGKRDNMLTWLNRTDSLLSIHPDETLSLETAISRGRLYNVNNDSGLVIAELGDLRDRFYALADTQLILSYHSIISHAYSDEKRLELALEHLLDAQALNPGDDHPERQVILDQSFATYYWEAKEWEKSLEAFERSAAYHRSTGNLPNLQQALTNIAHLHRTLGRHEKAMEVLEQVSELQEQSGSLVGFFTSRLNLVQLLVELDNFDRAYSVSLENLDLARQYGKDSAHILYWHGVIHRGLDQYDVAADYIERAFQEGQRRNHFGQCTFYSYALYQTFLWKDRFEEALNWHVVHLSYKDSLAQDRREKEVAPLLARLDNLEKAREIEKLENEATIAAERRRQLLIILFLTALLGGGIAYSQYRRRQLDRQLQSVEMRNLQLENNQLEQDLAFKEREITTHLLNLAQRNTQLRELQTSLSVLPADSEGELNRQIAKLGQRIDGHLEEDQEWNAFQQSFQRLHANFKPQLMAAANNLSPHEIRLASLLKINLSNREIANLLNITDEGLKKARYRLRKKLGLEGVGSLEEFLLKL